MSHDATLKKSLLIGTARDRARRVEVALKRSASGFKIVLSDAEIGEIESDGSDFFECFQNLRRVLAISDLHCFCQGARLNVWPSGMARRMSDGLKAYVLKVGQRPSAEDLVEIFADADGVRSVDDQIAFFDEWKRSINAT